MPYINQCDQMMDDSLFPSYLRLAYLDDGDVPDIKLGFDQIDLGDCDDKPRVVGLDTRNIDVIDRAPDQNRKVIMGNYFPELP